jgi:hypothetical protein
MKNLKGMRIKMKSFGIVLIMSLFLAFSAGTSNASLPKNYQEFKSKYQTEGKTPEGALKMYFEAVYFCIENKTPVEGLNMLRYAMLQEKGWEGRSSNQTFVSRLKDPGYHHIFRSFAVGSSPENDYKMSSDNFTLSIKQKTKQGDEYMQLSIVSTGADSPRPIMFKRVDGLWYITSNAGTYAGVRPPKSPSNKNTHDADFDSD